MIADPSAVTCLEATYESGVGLRGTFIGTRPCGWWIRRRLSSQASLGAAQLELPQRLLGATGGRMAPRVVVPGAVVAAHAQMLVLAHLALST